MIPRRIVAGLGTLVDEPVRHPWLRTPDELVDDVAPDLPAPRDVYRWAIQRGWSSAAAGNWAAFVAGVPIVDGDDGLHRAWRLREVQHLEFLRALVVAGRLAGDTAAAT